MTNQIITFRVYDTPKTALFILPTFRADGTHNEDIRLSGSYLSRRDKISVEMNKYKTLIA
jgi:hypothetical protein